MNTDFYDAHDRHWQDAELLYAKQRWANADHLYGIAAECGLKQLMQAFGMPFDTVKDKPVAKRDTVHADGIWTRFESYRSGHHLGAAYVLPTANPFANWNASQRYAPQSHFDQTRVDPHHQGAEQVRRLIEQARLEGLV